MSQRSDELSVEASNSIESALLSRRSIRAFLKRPVPREDVEYILQLASFAPSGSNFQPWRVHVLGGKTLEHVTSELSAAFFELERKPNPEYPYYMDPIIEPYLSRRRACGWGMYGALGIQRYETTRQTEQRARNYRFFDAPIGLVFTIDRRMAIGAFVDYGMFLQSITLAARSLGLHTCTQASIAEYPDVLRRELGLSTDEMPLCGMSVGYADPAASVNQFRPNRESVAAFARFYD
ncbi:nitroreductase [Paraburkholderia sp. 22B1P]|uniref:nitroreductase n=1 Tax=Paraburkholderia sp. 22B1P TaxID=3080498 RepID=UPI0030913CE7|nr:nitroreductase [Paraburkholderia sp. 22B1P]